MKRAYYWTIALGNNQEKVSNKREKEMKVNNAQWDKRKAKIDAKRDQLEQKHPNKTQAIASSANKAHQRAYDDWKKKRDESMAKANIGHELVDKVIRGKANAKTKAGLNKIYGTNYEAVDNLRLQVYEAFESGMIDENEKIMMLEYLDVDNYE